LKGAVVDNDQEVDETNLTEITILPDGRVYVFGLSREVLEVLHALQGDDPRIQGLLERARAAEKAPAEGEVE
jgi:hypothetical protein